jgi:heterotetrameric sarcosine oxidase alpha subunit
VNQGVRRGSRLSEEAFEFTFDGRRLRAQRGDSAASALLANGIRLLGRSVKYRRGRGLLSVGPEEPNALVTVGRAPSVIPNIPAPLLELAPDMVLSSQNRWPTLRLDLAALLRLGGGLLSTGFYYKTFIWPSWRFYEGMIRRLAGLGPAPGACTVPAPCVQNLDCDVLIAGAGASGLAAATAAARAGARVILCERERICGGELEFETATVEGMSTAAWMQATLAELERRDVRVFTSTAVIGGTNGLAVAFKQPRGLPGTDTLYRIRPRAFVIAMGAVERPLAFVDNDRPGVMLLSAAERLLTRYGVHAGRQVVLFGNHDRLYPAARRLGAGGVRVRAIIDTRSSDQARATQGARRDLEREGVECLMGHAVVAALGWLEVRGAKILPLGGPGASARTIPCDAVLMSGGWSPAIHAGLQEGGASTYVAGLTAFTAGEQPERRVLCGAARGVFELGEALADGHAAGGAAARAAAATADSGEAPLGSGDGPPSLLPFWRSPAARAAEKRQFVDFQNDVTVADLRQSLAEGFTDIEHIKRYTTLGIGTDQGRTSAVLGAAIVAELAGQPLAKIGQFRARAPYQPATLKTLAGLRSGPLLQPVRRTPLHEWHNAHGSVPEAMGLWMRPRYYAANGADAFSAGCAEARCVRDHGGICDGSTLGKIEVAGSDAAEFLDRLYLTRASTIKVGRSKYMVNLREDGMVLDDGLVLRLAPDRYLATTSSGHAGHMLSHFEFYRDTEWHNRAVALTDVTEAWAVIVCAGPASRDALRTVLDSHWHDSLQRLTHMEFGAGRWRGSALRVLRASFSGELAFEVHCPPRNALPLWEALIRAGMAPYGLEALDILRVEKGYLVGSELNGQTTPFDLGMERLVKTAGNCVGRELLDRPAFHESTRPKLVGVRAANGRAMFLAGAQLTASGDRRRSLGHVTSTVYSPALGEWIGLALLSREHAREDGTILAQDPLRGGDTLLRITPTAHFDAAGERMKA